MARLEDIRNGALVAGKHLRWRHIDFNDELVKLDARITKNRKPREVVGRDPAMTRLKAIRTRQDYVAKVFGATVKQSDYVFSLPDVSGGNFQLEQVKSFRTAFNNLLKACGFQYDALSQKHAITSLRHTYATIRLEEGTAIEALSNNMGTSVRMIQQHYGHVRTRDQREELTKQRTRLA
jgi:integrase